MTTAEEWVYALSMITLGSLGVTIVMILLAVGESARQDGNRMASLATTSACVTSALFVLTLSIWLVTD